MPLNPGGGFIISGDPVSTVAAGRGDRIVTAMASQVEMPGLNSPRVTGIKDPATTVAAGRGDRFATARTGQVDTPGLNSPSTTGVAGNQFGKTKLVKCEKSRGVPLDFSPSTSKTAKARAAKAAQKTLKLGAAKPRSAGPPVQIVSKGVANKTSGSQPSPPPSSSGASKKSLSSKAVSPNRKKTANQISGSQPVADERPRKHVTPARRAFIRQRAAERIVGQLAKKPAESLNTDELTSLKWARTFLADRQKPPSTSSDMPKRQRSEEEVILQGQQPVTKRHKLHSSVDKPFNEVIKNHLVRAVIDRSNADCTISHANWELVRKSLMKVLGLVLKNNPGPFPQCEDAGWFRGRVKLMACSNDRSALLLKQAIGLLGGLWEGAKLDVVSPEEIPRRPRATARIPDEPSDAKEIMELLRSGNPELPTYDWKVAKVSESDGVSRRIVVLLNQESLAPLRERRGKMYYGFEAIFLRVYRGDGRGALVQEGENPPPDNMSVDETVSLGSRGTTISNSGLVGDFFEGLDETVDEDVLLDSDQEDVNVTIISANKNGEGNASEPSPL